MKSHFYFGESVKGYEVPVLNEREIRAGAGILFVLAFFAFLNVVLLQNFYFLKIFIIFFLLDFTIRLFVNPKFSPVLVLGRWVVSTQTPEYAGAPQKKFAWGLGFGMAAIMYVLVVLLEVKGPVNFIMCLICLTFLFLETSFGICVGCKLYNLFNKEKAKLCPGGACEMKFKEKIQDITMGQVIISAIFFALILYIALAFR